MIQEVRYTNIRVVWEELLAHPLIAQELTLEQMVQYVIRFNGIFHMPKLYERKQACVDIVNGRGVLPCDLIAIEQVKDPHINACIRLSSATFMNPRSVEYAYTTRGQFIYPTFKTCSLEVAYKAIPIDDEGYPLLLDNEVYKNTLKLYIKKDLFTTFFERDKISIKVLQNTQQEYAWAAGQLEEELKMPSLAEMENISNAHNQLLMKPHEFKKGFETTGMEERYRVN